MRGKARPLHVVGDLPADRVPPFEVPAAQHGRVQVVRCHQVLPQHVVVFLEAHHVTCGTGCSVWRGPSLDPPCHSPAGGTPGPPAPVQPWPPFPSTPAGGKSGQPHPPPPADVRPHLGCSKGVVPGRPRRQGGGDEGRASCPSPGQPHQPRLPPTPMAQAQGSSGGAHRVRGGQRPSKSLCPGSLVLPYTL